MVGEFVSYQKGLVLVTGETGSGKSTTLAAIMGEINRTRPDHIITLEDPIEYVYESELALVNQREVGRHTESFAAGLRAILREDPDVILVGEMRDLETIECALTAAETGHLVFGTLHTQSAADSCRRLDRPPRRRLPRGAPGPDPHAALHGFKSRRVTEADSSEGRGTDGGFRGDGQ